MIRTWAQWMQVVETYRAEALSWLTLASMSACLGNVDREASQRATAQRLMARARVTLARASDCESPIDLHAAIERSCQLENAFQARCEELGLNRAAYY